MSRSALPAATLATGLNAVATIVPATIVSGEALISAIVVPDGTVIPVIFPSWLTIMSTAMPAM